MFVQFAGMVMASVGVFVISGVGVKVEGTKPAFVGASVAVMKFEGVGVFASSICTDMQEDKRIRRRNGNRILFFMEVVCSWI